MLRTTGLARVVFRSTVQAEILISSPMMESLDFSSMIPEQITSWWQKSRQSDQGQACRLTLLANPLASSQSACLCKLRRCLAWSASCLLSQQLCCRRFRLQGFFAQSMAIRWFYWAHATVVTVNARVLATTHPFLHSVKQFKSQLYLCLEILCEFLLALLGSVVSVLVTFLSQQPHLSSLCLQISSCCARQFRLSRFFLAALAGAWSLSCASF